MEFPGCLMNTDKITGFKSPETKAKNSKPSALSPYSLSPLTILQSHVRYFFYGSSYVFASSNVASDYEQFPWRKTNVHCFKKNKKLFTNYNIFSKLKWSKLRCITPLFWAYNINIFRFSILTSTVLFSGKLK